MKYCYREFAVVEFPEEEINGIIPLGIISTSWLIEEDCQTYCLWPSYLNSAAEREKIILDRLPLDKAKCDRCYVNVVYSTSKHYCSRNIVLMLLTSFFLIIDHYQNAINKLTLLEKASYIPLM